MTYSSKETSAALGRPKLLVDFYDDFENHWRYNSGTTIVTHLTFAYAPDKLEISEPEITQNPFRNEIKVTLSRGNAFATPYLLAPLESKVSLIVYRLLDSDYVFYWSGVVKFVAHDKNVIPTVSCYPKTSSSSRVGRRRVSQKLCDVTLYGQEIGGCLVNKELFKIEGVLDSIDGTTLTSASFNNEDEDWLKGGEIVIGNARRLIVSHTEETGGIGTVIIDRSILDPETDTGGDINFVVYAGCDHLKSTCVTKFDNGINYAGQEALPERNPYVGDPIIY